MVTVNDEAGKVVVIVDAGDVKKAVLIEISCSVVVLISWSPSKGEDDCVEDNS